MTSITIIRWVLLALATLALLSATVLFDLVYNFTVRPWLRLSERLLSHSTETHWLHGLNVGERLFRAWQLLWAALFLLAWRYLGTSAGARTVTAIVSPAGQMSTLPVMPRTAASMVAFAAL